jgi:hypothetical protein
MNEAQFLNKEITFFSHPRDEEMEKGLRTDIA